MPERSRDEIEEDAQELEHLPEARAIFVQNLMLLEVLLDVRDVLYRIEKDRVPKWGIKL